MCLALWAAQGPVSVTVVSRVCSVTMVALVACTPLALVAIQPVTSVGWRRPNGDAVGVFFPSKHHAYHGSLVTPSICFWTPPPLPLVSARTRVRDV